ncbi:RNA polymerase sigma factor [Shigella sonnei]|nr:RNA polymerase sigma factor [Shigella sonnei]
MSQNTLKVHDLNEDAEFDENGVEVFDEKALVEEEPSDNDLTVIAGSHTACVGRDSALPW